MQFVRLVVFGFIAMTVVYVGVSLYSRSVRKEKLEKEWDEMHPGSTDTDARAAHVADGLTIYDGSLRKRLILLVYVVPTLLITTIMFMIN